MRDLVYRYPPLVILLVAATLVLVQ